MGSTPNDASTTALCPRCRVNLFEARASGVVMQGCGACGGIWLDNDGCARAMSVVDRDILALVERADTHASKEPRAVRPEVPCVVCAQPMTRVRAVRSSVEIDVCYVHGTWFDAHELRLAMIASAAPEGDPSRASSAPGAGASGGGGSDDDVPDFRDQSARVGGAIAAEGAVDILGIILSCVT